MPKLSPTSRTIAILLAIPASTTISFTQFAYAQDNENCRSATSTQSLSCLGVRCKPQHTGGCNDNEYTAQSTQRSCDNNPDIEQVGEATVCYYDLTCCPNDLMSAINNNDNDWYEDNTNGWDNSNEEWDNEWPDNPEMYVGSGYTTPTQKRDEGGNSVGAGLGFAFMIIIMTGIFIAANRWKKNQQNSNAAAANNNEGGGDVEIQRSSTSSANRKKRKKKKPQQRTIYDSDYSDDSDNSSIDTMS